MQQARLTPECPTIATRMPRRRTRKARSPTEQTGRAGNGGAHLRMFVAPTTAPVPPGTLSGWQLEADLNFADIYNAVGHAGQEALAMSRFNNRFAALFDNGDGSAWQGR